MTDSVGYKQVTQAAAATLKTGPATLYGLDVVASTAGTVTIYDGVAASGNVLFTKTGLAVGEVIPLCGGLGVSVGVGLHVVVGGTGTVNVFYR